MAELEITDNTDPWYSEDMDGHVISGSNGLYCPGVDGFYDPPKGLHTGDDCPVCENELDC